MASQIATRNIFRFVYGKKFWDQIYSLIYYKAEWTFSLFLKLFFISFFAKYFLTLANLRFFSFNLKFILYCIVWRSMQLFSLKNPKKWRRGLPFLTLHKRRLLRAKKVCFVGKRQNQTIFWLKLNWKKRQVWFKKKKHIFKNFILKFSGKKTIHKNVFKNNTITPSVINNNFLLLKFNLFSLLKSILAKTKILVIFTLLKKRWFLERFFTLTLGYACQLVFRLFGLKQIVFKPLCILNDFGLVLRTKITNILNLSTNKIKYKPRKGYFISFYNRAGLKVSKAGRLNFIWRNWLLFIYYANLTKDWNSILEYCKWFFQTWQRKKQGVFFFFLRRIFGHSLITQFFPFETSLKLPWIFITFSGRVHGKQKASFVSLKPAVNYLQPFQKLNKNLLHYYYQLVTKYCIYGIHWWVLYNEFVVNSSVHQVMAKL